MALEFGGSFYPPKLARSIGTDWNTRTARWAAADLGRLQVRRHTDTLQTLSPDLTAPVLAAASLELKAEKQGAHSQMVKSVAFSPDGKSIVSGSFDETIKVWDAGTPACPIPPLAQT